MKPNKILRYTFINKRMNKSLKFIKLHLLKKSQRLECFPTCLSLFFIHFNLKIEITLSKFYLIFGQKNIISYFIISFSKIFPLKVFFCGPFDIQNDIKFLSNFS
jgi:hypothetical protein